MRPGDRIPSVPPPPGVRAHSMASSLTTAVQAYLSLENRGLIEARPKSGFFVRSRSGWRVGAPDFASQTLCNSGRSWQLAIAHLRRGADDGCRAARRSVSGAANLPVAKLSRIMASMARSAGARGISYECRPAPSSCAGQSAKRSLDRGQRLSLTTSSPLRRGPKRWRSSACGDEARGRRRGRIADLFWSAPADRGTW